MHSDPEVVATRGDEVGSLYVLNDDEGRLLAHAVENGRVDSLESAHGAAAWRVERPNIFGLYEQNVGLLQPLIVEELREAEKTYPRNWIEDAFRIAVERNVRNWRYTPCAIPGTVGQRREARCIRPGRFYSRWRTTCRREI